MTKQTAPQETAPKRITKAGKLALAEARNTAECVHILTMDEATEHATTLVGRLARAGLLYRGFYTCTLSGVRTLYVRRDCTQYMVSREA